MERIKCTVHRITFANEENGFAVIKVKVRGFDESVAAVGSLAGVKVGAVLTLCGEWKNDIKHGEQFAVSSWEEDLPVTILGIERYLGSGLIKGIGSKYAKLIVAKFGEETLNIIEENSDALIEVEGIGVRRVEMITEAWKEQKEIKNIILFLQEHQVSVNHAMKIYQEYGNESIDTVKENPYKLADDIWGIGFITADTIAQKMGYNKESYYRCRSGIIYTLNDFADSGHCYAFRDELTEKAAEMLGVEEEHLNLYIDQMLSDSDLICEPPDMIYLPPLFFSENGAARRLSKIMSTPRQTSEFDVNIIITEVQETSDIVYDDIQKDAIYKVSQSKVLVLTGGPGTGKTTTTKGIISVFLEQGLKMILAAPTGRAAKRLSEATGLEAKTIHRLLESRPKAAYGKNENNPIEGDALIIDECSMIDIILFYNLLKAIPDEMIVILIGDANQLPSVGPGNVFYDIICSEVVPVVKLSQIYRQSSKSSIIMNAHRINRGEYPLLSNKKNSDFFYVEENNPSNIPGVISNLCSKRLPSYYNVSPMKNIQVLTPMQRGETGAMNLNHLLQNCLNPGKPYLKRGSMEYRLHDKVMQQKNNYDKEVFNGDMGVIESVNLDERTIIVDFDGRSIYYNFNELDELVLSYACTIHKSQGSEYPIVIIPISMQHFVMLQRNLLYTGITRAKKVMVLVGSKKAINYAVENNNVENRNTNLAKRLQMNEDMQMRLV